MADFRWDALAWTLASAIVTSVVGVRVRYARPAEDGYNGLFVGPPGATVAHPHIELRRGGSAVFRGEHGSAAAEFDAAVWDNIAQGNVGVVDTAGELAQHFSSQAGGTPTSIVASYRLIAAALIQAALFGVVVRVRQAVGAEAGVASIVHAQLAAYGPGSAEIVSAVGDPAELWLLSVPGQDGETPLACVSGGGYLQFPLAAGAATVDYSHASRDTAGWELLHRGSGSAGRAGRLTLGAGIAAHAEAGVPDVGGFGIAAYLSEFNRKERFYLFNYAAGSDDLDEIHAPSVRPSSRFRADLGAALGLTVPAHAFVAFDDHLTWLYAALQWRAGHIRPHDPQPPPSREALPAEPGDGPGPDLVDGTQQDSDVVIAWSDNDKQQVVVLEAKSYGSWENKQYRSKLDRYKQILSAASGVDVRFVLASPHRPVNLSSSEPLPCWARDMSSEVERPAWIRFANPGLRVATIRCTEQGVPSNTGHHWKITGPT